VAGTAATIEKGYFVQFFFFFNERRWFSRPISATVLFSPANWSNGYLSIEKAWRVLGFDPSFRIERQIPG
jgi:hypothetical protein